ncbi:MAG TPA: hypothetical protein VNJ28_08580 [Candidatus Limnocylindrales bacterium]|nr:hypothetical protein [Candidatus Limnocylindrales bacterium]
MNDQIEARARARLRLARIRLAEAAPNGPEWDAARAEVEYWEAEVRRVGGLEGTEPAESARELVLTSA